MVLVLLTHYVIGVILRIVIGLPLGFVVEVGQNVVARIFNQDHVVHSKYYMS